MILDEYVEIGISNNKQYLIDKGYDIPIHKDKNGRESVSRGTKISVAVNDLPKDSHAQINIQCDHCGKKLKTTYQAYNDRVSKYGDYACKSCINKHQKITVQERYGVENISQIDDVKNKKIEKSLEKYGVPIVSQSKEVQDKMKQTNLQRYGKEYYYQTDDFKNKSKETIIEKYGSLDAYHAHVTEKVIETNRDKYGVDWYTQTDEYKEKYKQTCIDKYGVDHSSKDPEVRKKQYETLIKNHGEDYYKSDEFRNKFTSIMMERTGYEYPTQNPETKQLIRDTFYERYGGWYTATEEYKEKYKNTCLKKYGVEHTMHVPEIVEKIRTTMQDNGNVPTSIQQLYLHNLFGGIINYPFNYYSLDIYNPENEIAVEYSGGGHDLGVKLNRISEEEFEHKEIIRASYIKKSGMKLIEIICPNDLLPSDDVLIKMYELAENYFNNTNHTWIQFYPEDGKYKNAEYQDGADFNYGNLRRIKKDDVKEVVT